jgi:nanoRNase/pAp phosphatase (c-di-AMP/oligoRNAs hydrolase)
LDLRNEDVIYPGNRFMLYALFPEVTASIHVLDGLNGQNTVFALGKSIINTNNINNIFEIVSIYNGGGHKDAGTCQVSHQEAQNICNQLVKSLKSKELETV